MGEFIAADRSLFIKGIRGLPSTNWVNLSSPVFEPRPREMSSALTMPLWASTRRPSSKIVAGDFKVSYLERSIWRTVGSCEYLVVHRATPSARDLLP